ncbi:DUF2442 domain-containing protein [Salegentibacter sp. HM20]
MKTSKVNSKITEVSFRDGKVFFSLEDGLEIGSPLKWFPKLYRASEEELMDYTISPGGYGVHWNKVDEDLSAYGMLSHLQDQNANTI